MMSERIRIGPALTTSDLPTEKSSSFFSFLLLLLFAVDVPIIQLWYVQKLRNYFKFKLKFHCEYCEYKEEGSKSCQLNVKSQTKIKY